MASSNSRSENSHKNNNGGCFPGCLCWLIVAGMLGSFWYTGIKEIFFDSAEKKTPSIGSTIAADRETSTTRQDVILPTVSASDGQSTTVTAEPEKNSGYSEEDSVQIPSASESVKTDEHESNSGATVSVPSANTAVNLSGVPENLKSSYFLQWRGKGSCEYLTGNVCTILIFVDDAENAWSDSEIRSFMSGVYNDIDQINQNAAGRVSLNLFAQYRHCRVNGVTDNIDENVINAVLTASGLSDGSDINSVQNRLEMEMGAQAVPLVFVLKKDGRGLAYQGGACEYVVLYQTSKSFKHELYHLFGAKDFYYPDTVRTAAQNYLGDSIMNSGSHLDDLTAYLIGWMDTPSSAALDFLHATRNVTEAEAYDEYKQNAFTGYGTITYPNGSVYTGDLQTGIANGKGTIVFANGVTYSGDFVWGAISGQGSMQYPNGTVCTGTFSEGIIIGPGTMTYADGTTYQGSFANGLFEGSGTIVYADGNSYKGDFSRGKMHGYGVFRWNDGARYEGEYNQGQFHGRGTLIYPNGSVLSGIWNNGNFVG